MSIYDTYCQFEGLRPPHDFSSVRLLAVHDFERSQMALSNV
jgi:hypothetical protein